MFHNACLFRCLRSRTVAKGGGHTFGDRRLEVIFAGATRGFVHGRSVPRVAESVGSDTSMYRRF